MIDSIFTHTLWAILELEYHLVLEITQFGGDLSDGSRWKSRNADLASVLLEICLKLVFCRPNLTSSENLPTGGYLPVVSAGLDTDEIVHFVRKEPDEN
ncbi:hypothetical protein N9B31_05475 [Mariniblastus sp.]|nr:hypothetical protein [bacterium]MDA7903095.1 hypothetical protein [Mariniblastus sp.]MDA7923918.1 hypothetical protein [Mariniblastus sp.]MDB4460457.1 hypothetical protein [bacterium]MDB4473149.1 hypothetical protein [bacterium]